MRFTAIYPIGAPAFVDPRNVLRLAQAIEAADIDALGFTEHPAPTLDWLRSSEGHQTLDPLSALAFCAAGTTRIRLMTWLLVLPYRNPLLAAKQIATVDVLSGGRLIVGAGAGYLPAEFAGLGVDFSERNELFDESLKVLNSLWGGEGFDFQGRHFRADGQSSLPSPVQLPHPPLWIGGNGGRARQRVADSAQGWAPMLVDKGFSTATRTKAMGSVAALRTSISDLRRRLEQAGRDPSSIDVQVLWPAMGMLTADPRQVLAALEELAEAGVTWFVILPPGGNIDHSIETIAAYGETVIKQTR